MTITEGAGTTGSARALPVGTVTFLMTDVVGSTRLWNSDPGLMGTAMVVHDRLIEDAIAQAGGVVVRPRGEGDSRFAVFATASDAVAGALAVQAALTAHPWDMPEPLRVRLALHTGEADLRDGDYYGSAVNRCARLRGLAHGGQILVSGATAALAREALPPGADLEDHGLHRLRDLTDAEHVFSLTHPSLQSGFPPLADADRRSNLPPARTTFVGRDAEIARLEAMLEPGAVVTLTGAGGCGKTRLAVQTARGLTGAFPDGCWLVELAPLSEPDAVARAIADVFAIQAPGDTLGALVENLASRRCLIVLDNCEHVLDPAATVADAIAEACPEVTLLATSREPLGIRGEKVFRLPSLSTATDGGASAAARLFLDRARDVAPEIDLSGDIDVVEEVCARLDGIPLAIELATGTLAALSISQLRERLGDRFRLLTGGRRMTTERHRTLRAAVDHSWALLAPNERELLNELSVFAGPFTLDAAETVCSGDDILGALAALVRKSLVQRWVEDDEAVYRLNETIRQYGAELLASSGSLGEVRERHARAFVARAQVADIPTPATLAWCRRMTRELDDMRLAREWLSDHGDAEASMRMALGAARLLWARGPVGEARVWLDETLPFVGDPALRARGRAWLAWFEILAGAEFDRAEEQTARAVEEALASGDPRVLAEALALRLANLSTSSRPSEFSQTLSDGFATCEAAGDDYYRAFLVAFGAWGQILQAASRATTDHDAAALMEQALRAVERQGDLILTSHARYWLALDGEGRADLDRARAHYEHGLEAARAGGLALMEPQIEHWLARVLFRVGEGSAGRAMLQRAAIGLRAAGQMVSWFHAVLYSAQFAALQGDFAAARAALADANGAVEGADPRWIGHQALPVTMLCAYLEGDVSTLRIALDAFRAVAAKMSETAATDDEDLSNTMRTIAGWDGMLAFLDGDPVAAASLLMQETEGTAPRNNRSIALECLARISLASGDLSAAAAHLRAALDIAERIFGPAYAKPRFGPLPVYALRAGRAVDGARLAGAESAWRAVEQTPVPVPERARWDAELAELRAALGDAAFAEAFDQGRAMARADAIALARDVLGLT